jgi:indole-3-glycerol phosphate synthase
MTEKLNIDLSQTPEKFEDLGHEILDFLIGKLLLIDALEQEIYDRYQVLEEKRASPNQTHPDEEDLWDEYAQRCKEIIAPISIKTYNDSRSFGNQPLTNI